MRTLQNLLAVDAVTGKRLWEIPVDETAEIAPGYLDAGSADAAGDAGVRGQSADVGRRDLRHAQQRRPLRVFGRGLGVGIGAGDPPMFRRVVIWEGGCSSRRSAPAAQNNESAALCNRLAAHDIRTGKLKWQLGGPAGQYALRQAETFFLGPPLASDGAALRVGRDGRERFGCWRWTPPPATSSGRSNWPRRRNNRIAFRRFAGASPSYADGILVCPTSAGAVVGVELATRSLLWGYCYNPNPDSERRNNGFMFIPNGVAPEQAVPLTGSTAAPRSARAACWSLPWNRNSSIV